MTIYGYNGGSCSGPDAHDGCSYVYATIDANNHGRHYYEMGSGCSSYTHGGWWNNPGTFTGSNAPTNTGSWDGYGGCQSSYSWNSGSGSHLCNDDAAYELWQATNGPQDAWNFSVSQGSSKSGSANFSCECSGSKCSGDWGSPNCH